MNGRAGLTLAPGSPAAARPAVAGPAPALPAVAIASLPVSSPFAIAAPVRPRRGRRAALLIVGGRLVLVPVSRGPGVGIICRGPARARTARLRFAPVSIPTVALRAVLPMTSATRPPDFLPDLRLPLRVRDNRLRCAASV
jgi:hypothetical protein